MADKRKTTVRPRLEPIKIKDAQIMWPNFSGIGKKFNAEGDRNFHVMIDLETAEEMDRLGWNIKYHDADPEREGSERWASLKVAVRFDKYPPRIIMKSGGVTTPLSAETVGILDWADKKDVNLYITASHWENTKKETGFKAWLNRMSVTIDPDDAEFEGIEIAASRESVTDDD